MKKATTDLLLTIEGVYTKWQKWAELNCCNLISQLTVSFCRLVRSVAHAFGCTMRMNIREWNDRLIGWPWWSQDSWADADAATQTRPSYPRLQPGSHHRPADASAPPLVALQCSKQTYHRPITSLSYSRIRRRVVSIRRFASVRLRRAASFACCTLASRAFCVHQNTASQNV